MPRLRIAMLACAAGFLLTGVAGAATPEWHTTSVLLPDGSVAEIRYAGDIPPRVTVALPELRNAWESEEVYEDDLPARRIVQPRPWAAAPKPTPPRFIVGGDMPRGSTYEYTLITTGADGRVCTQRTEWLSRGRGKQPRVTRRDIGDGCAAASGAVPWLESEPLYPDAL